MEKKRFDLGEALKQNRIRREAAIQILCDIIRKYKEAGYMITIQEIIEILSLYIV